IIFEYNPSSNIFITRYTFTAGVATTNAPVGELTYFNNKLYGATTSDGASFNGTLFEFDLASETFTKRADLSSTLGTSHRGTLVLAPNGKLYGTMSKGGGSTSAGTVFELDPVTNLFTKRRDFDASTGREPNGLTLASNGKFYG